LARFISQLQNSDELSCDGKEISLAYYLKAWITPRVKTLAISRPNFSKVMRTSPKDLNPLLALPEEFVEEPVREKCL
jgi:hypothetical protein